MTDIIEDFFRAEQAVREHYGLNIKAFGFDAVHAPLSDQRDTYWSWIDNKARPNSVIFGKTEAILRYAIFVEWEELRDEEEDAEEHLRLFADTGTAPDDSPRYEEQYAVRIIRRNDYCFVWSDEDHDGENVWYVFRTDRERPHGLT